VLTGRLHRPVAPDRLVADQLELVGVLGALEMREAGRPLRQLGDVAGEVDHVLVGDFDEQDVRQVRADRGHEREQRQEERCDRRPAGVALDNGVSHVLEHQRRERPARVVEEREREDRE
jgi:hypothetical protein